MNLLFTLFGGMLLTAALYGILRRFGVGNFWAAVTATGGVCLAYMIYAGLTVWPGLDTFAMHLVAYPTVAVVLAQLYDTRKGQSLHWIPRLIVGLFLAVSVLFGGLVYISSRGLPQPVAQWFLPKAQGKGLHTGFAGVVAHTEEAAKGIGQHLKAEHALARLGWHLEVRGLDGLTPDRAAEVTVLLRGRDGQPVDGARIHVALGRPGQPAGPALSLVAVRPGAYQITIEPLSKGAWVAYLGIAAASEEIALEHAIEVR